jgi:hypothetical protein
VFGRLPYLNVGGGSLRSRVILRPACVASLAVGKMTDPKDAPCFSPGDSADEYRNRVQEWVSFFQVAAGHNPKVHGLIKANLAEYLVQGLAPSYRATIRKMQRDGSLPVTD